VSKKILLMLGGGWRPDYRERIAAGVCDGVTPILPHNVHAEVTNHFVSLR